MAVRAFGGSIFLLFLDFFFPFFSEPFDPFEPLEFFEFFESLDPLRMAAVVLGSASPCLNLQLSPKLHLPEASHCRHLSSLPLPLPLPFPFVLIAALRLVREDFELFRELVRELVREDRDDLEGVREERDDPLELPRPPLRP